MTHLILFDSEMRNHLLPLTFTRPLGDLRVGIMTIREKWEERLGLPASFLTQDYLSESYPIEYGERNLVINGSVLPTDLLTAMLVRLQPGTAYLKGDELIGACLDKKAVESLIKDEDFGELQGYEIGDTELLQVKRPGDIFGLNDQALREDFSLLRPGRTSAQLPEHCQLVGPEDQLFIAPDAELEPCIINTASGPVYISKGAKILAGAMLRGPLYLGKDSVVKMGAKIYGGTSIGPSCKVGGEINNAVLYANCNKGHDGYLGNSVLGEWCNLGADTNVSNLKNDYGEVRSWSYVDQRFTPTGRQFHGLIMGDHSKTAINCMLNTGTVVGVSANVFGDGFPRPFIPSFSWGGASGKTTYKLDKALATAERVMQRRGQEISPAYAHILKEVFQLTEEYRG
ncbi:MAG: GlmU family protein [Bacteroidota bacterium]